MITDRLQMAKKSYLTSLKDKLNRQYMRERSTETKVDRRWINGFMAAGYHGGLISLSDLKLECLSAYRRVYEKRMEQSAEMQLERRLTKLCEEARE